MPKTGQEVTASVLITKSHCLTKFLIFQLCTVKGFMCEYCRDYDDILYPFELNRVATCPCKFVYSTTQGGTRYLSLGGSVSIFGV